MVNGGLISKLREEKKRLGRFVAEAGAAHNEAQGPASSSVGLTCCGREGSPKIFSAICMATFSGASRVDAPRCGVQITLLDANRIMSVAASTSWMSIAAPATSPDCGGDCDSARQRPIRPLPCRLVRRRS